MVNRSGGVLSSRVAISSSAIRIADSADRTTGCVTCGLTTYSFDGEGWDKQVSVVVVGVSDCKVSDAPAESLVTYALGSCIGNT